MNILKLTSVLGVLLVWAPTIQAEDLISIVGKKLIEVVVDGKAQTTLPEGQIHFLPREERDPMNLVGWRGHSCNDVTQTVEEGALGQTVAWLTYRVVYEYNGSKGQKGRYLSAVQVIPVKVYTKALYSFNVKLEVGNPVNAGTLENPIPRVRLLLKFKIHDEFLPTGDREKTDEITLDGVGTLDERGECRIVQAKR